MTYRFAKWKRDAEYWHKQNSIMFEKLFQSVNEKLVRLLLREIPRPRLHQSRRKA